MTRLPTRHIHITIELTIDRPLDLDRDALVKAIQDALSSPLILYRLNSTIKHIEIGK